MGASRGLGRVDLCDLRFDNSFVRELPGDPVPRNVPRQVRGACYTRVDADAGGRAALLAWSDAVGRMLGASPPRSPTGPVAEVLGGNRVLPGMQPYAARYGGHQFGHWAGQLGDGRAITLGEVVGPDGARWDLQLKGAGPTPYSRTADGRAVLRSSVREFMCSEAMHHLGVPTTRALEPGGDRRAGGARHVLRRPPARRAGRHRLPRGAVVRALRQLRDPRRAPRARRAAAARRLRDHRALPGARRAGPRPSTPAGSRRSAGAPP